MSASAFRRALPASVFRRALPAAAFLALAGCSTFTFDYRALDALAPEGTDFNAEVARAYQTFATTEANARMDWVDAAHFGEKAFAAARATRVEPEDPAQWRLPDDAQAPIAQGRDRLIAVFVRGARETHPKTAATAQARFDCWVEEREENWQTENIAACRDGFFAALNELEERIVLSQDPRPRTDAAPSAAPEPSTVSPAVDETDSQVSGDGASSTPISQPEFEARPLRVFTVFFGFDSAVLDDGGLATLRAVADHARQGSGTGLAIAGHTDRAGGEAYNLDLSRKRAHAVADALKTFGVPANAIAVRAMGEATPLVDTLDGVREPKNRRVEINTRAMP